MIFLQIIVRYFFFLFIIWTLILQFMICKITKMIDYLTMLFYMIRALLLITLFFNMKNWFLDTWIFVNLSRMPVFMPSLIGWFDQVSCLSISVPNGLLLSFTCQRSPVILLLLDHKTQLWLLAWMAGTNHATLY